MNPTQLYVLHCSFACLFVGFGLGLLYTLFEILGIIFDFKKMAKAVFDMIFFSAGAVVSFLLAYALNRGRLRFFQIALEGVGFCLILLTLYPMTVYPLRKLQGKIHSFFRKLRIRLRNARIRQRKLRQERIRLEKRKKINVRAERKAVKENTQRHRKQQQEMARRLKIQKRSEMQKQKKRQKIAKRKTKQKLPQQLSDKDPARVRTKAD